MRIFNISYLISTKNAFHSVAATEFRLGRTIYLSLGDVLGSGATGSQITFEILQNIHSQIAKMYSL